MDPRTRAHLAGVREALLAREAELLASVHAREHARREDAERAVSEHGDHKEQSADWQATTQQEAEERREVAELGAVRAALARLEVERYGECIECGNPIPWKRLHIQPEAARCAECQSRAEHLPAPGRR